MSIQGQAQPFQAPPAPHPGPTSSTSAAVVCQTHLLIPAPPTSISSSTKKSTSASVKPGSKTNAGGGSNKGRQNYNDDDDRVMLECVEEILPLGANEWEQVAVKYNLKNGGARAFRDAESLKTRFKKHVNVKVWCSVFVFLNWTLFVEAYR